MRWFDYWVTGDLRNLFRCKNLLTEFTRNIYLNLPSSRSSSSQDSLHSGLTTAPHTSIHIHVLLIIDPAYLGQGGARRAGGPCHSIGSLEVVSSALAYSSRSGGVRSSYCQLVKVQPVMTAVSQARVCALLTWLSRYLCGSWGWSSCRFLLWCTQKNNQGSWK